MPAKMACYQLVDLAGCSITLFFVLPAQVFLGFKYVLWFARREGRGIHARTGHLVGSDSAWSKPNGGELSGEDIGYV